MENVVFICTAIVAVLAAIIFYLGYCRNEGNESRGFLLWIEISQSEIFGMYHEHVKTEFSFRTADGKQHVYKPFAEYKCYYVFDSRFVFWRSFCGFNEIPWEN